MDFDKLKLLLGRRFSVKPSLNQNISGNLIQAAVLLNGLFLTIVAYIALNFFISGALQEDRARAIRETSRTVSQNILDLEQAVKSTSLMLALADNRSDDQVRAQINYAVPNLSSFDRILWLEKDANNLWRAHNIIEPQQKPGRAVDTQLSKFLSGNEEKLARLILKETAGKGNDMLVLTDFDSSASEFNDNDPALTDRPFILAKPVIEGANLKKIVVAVAHISNVLPTDWMMEQSSIHSLMVRDSVTSRSLYSLSRDNYNRKASSGPPVNGQALVIGNSRWDIFVEDGQDASVFLISKAPILILILGGILTLFGTLYVRNKQKQSYQLKLINKVLAQKNFDLKKEMAERERLNKSLSRAEKEYKAIIDSVSDIIFEISGEGELIFLNGTWKKITGFDIEQSLHRRIFDLMHPQDQKDQRANFEQLVKGNKNSYRTFARIRTADGTFRAVEMTVSIMRQDENRKMRVVGTLTDVEERRRAEKALSEAEKKYRAIVENAAGGIYQVTPEGQYLSANPAMARILGYDSPERMLREIHNAHENVYVSLKERMRFIRDLESDGVVKNFETQVMTRDGRTIWVNENAHIVKDDDDNILYFEGGVEDITKRKEAEIKLREAKIHSDLASRAKSEFLANMSHELRTPLNAIIGFSEIIKDEVLGKLENRQYWEYSRDIYQSGKRLLDIINEILDVSRIEAGERQLNESMVNIGALLDECIDFVKPKLDAGKLNFVNIIDVEGLPELRGEELALKQIMINLLSNAIKFTPAGGHITLSQEIDTDGELRLSVTDTGVGLDEAEIEKALSPFGQVETSLSRSASGVGLGLTIVDSLVKLHGGRLELFSQKGIGTTATIIFPANRLHMMDINDSDGQDDEDDKRSSDIDLSPFSRSY